MVLAELHSMLVLHKRTVTEEELWRQLFVVSKDVDIVAPAQVNIMEDPVWWPPEGLILDS